MRVRSNNFPTMMCKIRLLFWCQVKSSSGERGQKWPNWSKFLFEFFKNFEGKIRDRLKIGRWANLICGSKFMAKFSSEKGHQRPPQLVRFIWKNSGHEPYEPRRRGENGSKNGSFWPFWWPWGLSDKDFCGCSNVRFNDLTSPSPLFPSHAMKRLPFLNDCATSIM